MKILHLYSDWKWTGPAEPVLQACAALQARGHEVLLAHLDPKHPVDESISQKVAEYGLRGTTRFCLDRHLPPLGTLRDLIRLPRFIRNQKFDIVNVHLCHDHAIGGFCVRLLGRAGPPLVRTLHRREVLPATLGYRFQIRRLADAWLAFTPKFREAYITRFGLPPDRVGVLPMTVDLERFRPQPGLRDLRPEFGVPPGRPVIGIVGRFQKYRRMDVFLEAAKRLLAEEPDVWFWVIGRSSQIQHTVVEPVARLGIGGRVVLTGYRIDDYVDLMHSLDIFTLLMPGFDGTARAVREALALGKPCVVSDFGMLPEIVRDGETGRVVPMSPEALAGAWLELVRSPQARRAMGSAARRYAEAHFRIDSVGPVLETFYRRVIESLSRPARPAGKRSR